MKKVVRSTFDQLLFRKRFIIETINDQIEKSISNRALSSSLTSSHVPHVIAGLITYSYQTKKPSLNLNTTALALL